MQNAKAHVAALAARQRGRVSRAQLIRLGLSGSTITRGIRAGYLFPELPGVYAVGHPGRSEESDLFAAVLYAGPGAGLSGLTGALHRGLIKWRTAPTIEVATPRRVRSLPATYPGNHLKRPIAVRADRHVGRAPYHGIPTVPIPHVVLGLAATGELQLVRFALAQLDFMRRLNVPALRSVSGPGIPGTSVLRQALETHQPLLARARSPCEVKLIHTCELTGIPLPELNVKIAGITPDAVWHEQRLIVQCDGEGNHGTFSQRRRDTAEDRILRSLDFYVIRYTSDQLGDPWAVHAVLTPLLRERRGLG